MYEAQQKEVKQSDPRKHEAATCACEVCVWSRSITITLPPPLPHVGNK
jgi:hypothetical protein